MLIETTDFVGKFELTQNMFTNERIQSYIDKYEKYYMTLLLGVTEYANFVNDLDVNNTPQSPIYELIYNPLQYDYDGDIIYSEGIKDMLLGLIYYRYILDNQQFPTSIGVVSQESENSNVLSINQITISRFNDSVATFRAIQSYIDQNSEDYPDYNGQELAYEYIL